MTMAMAASQLWMTDTSSDTIGRPGSNVTVEGQSKAGEIPNNKPPRVCPAILGAWGDWLRCYRQFGWRFRNGSRGRAETVCLSRW
jgi:hypothetical protein